SSGGTPGFPGSMANDAGGEDGDRFLPGILVEPARTEPDADAAAGDDDGVERFQGPNLWKALLRDIGELRAGRPPANRRLLIVAGVFAGSVAILLLALLVSGIQALFSSGDTKADAKGASSSSAPSASAKAAAPSASAGAPPAPAAPSPTAIEIDEAKP